MNFRKQERFIEIILNLLLGSSVLLTAMLIIFKHKEYLSISIFLFCLGIFLNIVYRYAKNL